MKKNPFNYISITLITITLGIFGFYTSSITPREYSWIPWALIALVFLCLNISCQSLINNLYDSLYHDPLTKLESRRYFNTRLAADLADTESKEGSLSLLMIDIDKFKKVNDTYGHSAGDDVLKQLAQVLRSCVREGDSVVRWGGEEFSIILPGIGCKSALTIAERMRCTVADSDFLYKSTQIKITISIGVASSNGNTSIDELVQCADKALYEAKKSRNLVIAA